MKRHFVFPQVQSHLTRRKARRLRIRYNKRKRETGLVSKSIFPIIQQLYKEEPFIGQDGWPISARAYYRHKEDPNYSIVACDWYRGVKISTVWLGKMWPDGFTDFLFETMTFDRRGKDTFQYRYRTEAQARAGHAAVLNAVRTLFGKPSHMHGEPVDGIWNWIDESFTSPFLETLTKELFAEDRKKQDT